MFSDPPPSQGMNISYFSLVGPVKEKYMRHFQVFLKKIQNAPRPEHSPVREKMSKGLSGIIGYSFISRYVISFSKWRADKTRPVPTFKFVRLTLKIQINKSIRKRQKYH